MTEQLSIPTIPADIVKREEPSVGSMLSAFIERGITAENVAAFSALVELKERLETRDAEKQFAQAFVAMQAEMPAIQKKVAVPNNDGSTRYKFAPYDQIMDVVSPILQRHGFATTFTMRYADGRVIQECTLQHIGGHKRTNQFMARIGSGPPKSSEAQGDGAASSFAKRYALCDALALVIETDTDGKFDARVEGAPITRDQVQFLKDEVADTGSDPTKFLAMAGAPSFEEIGSSTYDILVRFLQAKKRK